MSHHDGSHYNSVRMLQDSDTGMPLPITIAQVAPRAAAGEAEEDMPQDVHIVMDGSGVRDRAAVEQALGWFNNDVDATILFLLEESLPPEPEPAPYAPVTEPAPLPAAAGGCKNAGFYFADNPAVLRRACSSDCEDGGTGFRGMYAPEEQTPATQVEPAPSEQQEQAAPPEPPNKKPPAKKPVKPAKPPKLTNKERKEQKKRDKLKAAQVLAEYDGEPPKQHVSSTGGISI
eukprot:TRINITY_DN6178_c0_g1_i2.p1 TRINITY_DN6178_c0_g1~~TRINITY_DN6178_c0_g1_i2.p1  ORF type:complete len:231 (-),score=58.88 TRINITY_DN6178_c0_g1_i2:133-825(-)